MSYNQLSLEERYYIYKGIKLNKSYAQIAREIGYSPSTVSREVSRNRGQRGYRYRQAHLMALVRHKIKPKYSKLVPEIVLLINGYINKDWSPEQICGRLKLDNVIELHHETIYRYILKDKAFGGELYKHLRHKHKTYRKRYGSNGKSKGIPNRRDIDERPEEANNRQEVGHFEADTIIGKNHCGAIVTIDERKSKLRLSWPVGRKTARAVAEAIKTMLSPINALLKRLPLIMVKNLLIIKR